MADLKYWKAYFERQAARGKKLLQASNIQFGGASETIKNEESSVKFISPVQKTVNMVEARVKHSNQGQGQMQNVQGFTIKRRQKKAGVTSRKAKAKRKVKRKAPQQKRAKTQRKRKKKKKTKKLKKKIKKKQKNKKRVVRRQKKTPDTIFS
jgi:hypothetical protein